MVGHREGTARSDAGITVIDLLFSIVVVGMVMSTLSLAVLTSLRAAPDTETRIDDARATRSLATWLTSDTISAPPFMPETSQGGIVTDQDPLATDNNDCNQTGTNLLHLQWVELTDVERTFVANYRWSLDADGAGRIVRHVCVRSGPIPAAFTSVTDRTMTTGLTSGSPPTVTPIFDGPDVASIRFELTGATGETVRVDTGSRNPADFFP
ncbi:MAG: hypothetical protein HKN44_12050 [Ilumatobacter sp.]|nr:hypothetical protein [Ilumatobacter sp.]